MTEALRIQRVDPQHPVALALLQQAAVEVRALYDEPSPSRPLVNAALPLRGVYLLAWRGEQAQGMVAHYPFDDPALRHCTELRRLYVLPEARRDGVAWQLLEAVEAHAQERGFRLIQLETGIRQLPAIALYEARGYCRIAPFGAYTQDPTSVCFGKPLGIRSERG